jgi:hypothetical protein
VDEPGLGLIAGYAFSAQYEDLKLKAKSRRRLTPATARATLPHDTP